MRKEWKEQEAKWKKEREEIRDCIKGLERRMEELGGNGEKELKGVDLKEGMRKGSGIGEDRLREIERRIEMREREERRRNIILKGVEVKEGKRREAVEEVFKVLGVRAEMEEIKKLGGVERRAMLLVKLKGEEQKKEIMRRKRELKGRREKVMEDWT